MYEKTSNETLETIAKIFGLLSIFFSNDTQKIAEWLNTENLLLRGFSPWDLVRSGKEKKLLKFIETQEI